MVAGVREDSLDQWNQDRDDLIARQAENQTEARNLSGDANAAGWNDLDYYGNWYPVDGYGNVWVPQDAGAGFDPYGNGYWANYPGWGYTWISAYPWGWLPYHCGAWNNFDGFGWGWIPGQCGLGWVPVSTIWNVPHGYRPPPKPYPGGHAGPARVVQVQRGPGGVQSSQIARAEHTKPIRLDGQEIAPLPLLPNPGLTQRQGRLTSGDGHVGVPVGIVYGSPSYGTSNGNSIRRAAPPGSTAVPGNVRSPAAPAHPGYIPRPGIPPPAMTPPRPMQPNPMPSRPMPSAPVQPAPRPMQPPPMQPRPMAPPPHVSAPPAAAPAPH
jgi:hypothetical protein